MPALVQAHVCVVGGGPAGSAAARLLASWGWSAVLVHQPPRGPRLAESLPPSIRKLLQVVGVAQDVEAAGFFPNTGNTSSWAGHRRHSVAPQTGFHVPRQRWDDLLLSSAEAAGVRLIAATVRDVDLAGRPRITIEDHDAGRHIVDADYVIDCSGRAGVIARRGLRRAASYRTLAIAAEWVAPWPEDERTQTVVESYADGWAWSVPLGPTTRQCTVMVAALPRDRTDPSSPGTLQAAYARELDKTGLLAPRLAGAHQITPAWACDASVYMSPRAAEGRAVLAGDAASFIEPLSSAGVKKAMLSAWRAAIVVNTCLRDASRADVALGYHRARESRVFASCSGQAARFFADATAAYRHPFWEERLAFSAAEQTGDAGVTEDRQLLGSRDVLAAFQQLSESTRLAVSPAVRIAQTATIEGNEIVLRDAVALPGVAEPLRFASNVDLAALVGVVGQHEDISSAFAAYQSRVKPIGAADLLRGLSLLVARRAVLHKGTHP